MEDNLLFCCLLLFIYHVVMSLKLRNYWINENNSNKFCSGYFITHIFMGPVAVRKYGYDRSRMLRRLGVSFVGVKKNNLGVFKLKDQCLSLLIKFNASATQIIASQRACNYSHVPLIKHWVNYSHKTVKTIKIKSGLIILLLSWIWCL